MIGLYEGVAVIVQARLNSTRLFRKALLDLEGQPILYRVLASMRELPAQHFILACDENSKNEFKKIAESIGYTCIGGPENDVLKRFCDAIKIVNADFPNQQIKMVVRVTADNPFLFTQAAISSIRRYYELGEPDYFTYTGLPVGSGVELIKASSLLKANAISTSDYEREHVGPSIYYHTDIYRCIRETAQLNWYFPNISTTVDTAQDYDNAKLMMHYLVNKKKQMPFLPQDIIDAYNYVHCAVVFSPSVIPGRGSGHLRRVCDIVQALLEDVHCLIYIPENDIANFSEQILKLIPSDIIIKKLPKQAALIVLDRFQTTEEEMQNFKQIAPVVTIDDGGTGREYADFILDILPSLITENRKDIDQPVEKSSNMFSPAFIPLPKKRKTLLNKNTSFFSNRIKLDPKKTKVLVVCGGENSFHMVLPVAKILQTLKLDVTAIDNNLTFEDIKNFDGKIKIASQIENLREHLNEWDLVVTHYGFTAFEALAAGCYVVLISPTEYHYKLGIAAGFTTIPYGIPSIMAFNKVFMYGIKVPKIITPDSKSMYLPNLIEKLSYGRRCNCPMCGSINETNPHKTGANTFEIIARTPDRTVSRCLHCGMYFFSFIISKAKKYTKSYFFDEYKAQYGKTYLEDFESIRTQGLRRIKIIEELYNNIFYKNKERNIFDNQKKLLDIGCAYGAFISAAKYLHWNAIGTDIAESAIQYVRDILKLPAFVSAFPALPNSFEQLYKKEITGSGYEKISVPIINGTFSAVTLWFVIEHFQDLDAVLKRINALLMPGGILAFSTPNVSGVTGTFSPYKFFAQSPTDHYSIWDAHIVKKQLEKYGFKVLKIVSIGHHPERFKLFFPIKKNGIIWNIVLLISKIFKLGDSMEVYAMKHGTLEDVK